MTRIIAAGIIYLRQTSLVQRHDRQRLTAYFAQAYQRNNDICNSYTDSFETINCHGEIRRAYSMCDMEDFFPLWEEVFNVAHAILDVFARQCRTCYIGRFHPPGLIIKFHS